MARSRWITPLIIFTLIVLVAIMPVAAADETPVDEPTTTATTETKSSPQGVGLLFVLIGLGAVTAVGIGRWSGEIIRAQAQK